MFFFVETRNYARLYENTEIIIRAKGERLLFRIIKKNFIFCVSGR